MSEPISLTNVAVGYRRKRPVLEDVTFVARKGSVTGLLGRNGAGKTTLIHTALGLRKAWGGEALLFGHRAWDAPPDVRRRIGFVPQQFVNFHWLTPSQCIDLVSRFHAGWDAHVPAEIASPVLGGIAMRSLSFRYGTGEPLVLDDVGLDVPPGAFVAFTGPSGGGKSTLLKLMLGLYPPTSGDIRLDGALATPALWPSWRKHVGVVTQDDQLLSGTIADNISFFDPDIDMAKVRDAARAAKVHDDIVSMPMQYLSPVGDMGSTLSRGQHQRVLLARALYRDPQVLFLDEGTANLDQDTEAKIVELVASLPITRIVVAHRPALLEAADTVYRVADGTVTPLRSVPKGKRRAERDPV